MIYVVPVATIFLFGVLCGLRLAKWLDKETPHEH